MKFDKNKVEELKNKFDKLANIEESSETEYWYARELQKHLGYINWEGFIEVIKRAMSSCENTGFNITDHFRQAAKMVPIGSGAERSILDYMLTRYACYLIAQNGDSTKQEIAFAQSYFAFQTRKQEVIEERLKLIARMDARDKLKESEKQLSQNIYERGVDDQGFARIRSKGDSALFGGKNTSTMKLRYGVKDNRSLADFLPTLSIAAKNLATEMTNHNVKDSDLHGETSITNEHVQNNISVRNMLGSRGIKPENLSPEEDIKKLERRVKTEDKKIAKLAGKLPSNKN